MVSELEEPIRSGLDGLLSEWDGHRADRLRADLARLGADAPQTRPSAPALDAAEAFGAAYVLRGSELGAPFIARALSERLRLDADAMTYLQPKHRAGCAWPDFVAALDAFGARRREDRPRVLQSADATFGAFERAFAREGFA